MQKVSTRLSAVIGTGALLILSGAPALAIAPSAYAAHGADDNTTSTNTTASTSDETKNETEAADPTTDDTATHNRGSDTEAERLVAQKNAKLKLCQTHQRIITNIMSRIADRGQHRLNVITTIAERVEAFYASKGKTLANYDTLVADVNAKKAAAQNAVDSVKTDSTSFSCDSTSPSNAASSFRTALKAEQSAMEAYHKSVRNLTVGVKSVTGTTSSSSNQSTTGGNQ